MHTLQSVYRAKNERARAFLSEGGAYVEADLGINQRLLCDRNSTAVRGGDGELGLDRCAAFNQPQGDGAKLVVPCRAADKTDRAPIQL